MSDEIEQYDDYRTAAKYLIEKILASGDGKALRSVKTLMDAREKAEAELGEAKNEAKYFRGAFKAMSEHAKGLREVLEKIKKQVYKRNLDRYEMSDPAQSSFTDGVYTGWDDAAEIAREALASPERG